MARYLILILATALVACTYYSTRETQAASGYPETRSPQVQVSVVRTPGMFLAPRGDEASLAGFAQRASVADGTRARVRNFEVLYHAPNRHPGVSAPFLPASVPDRLMIMAKNDIFVEEIIPPEFSGSGGNRVLEVAQFDVGARHFLLVTAGSTERKPRWFAIFNDSGNVIYRAATPHGGFRFAQQPDGISMVDDAGYGKRFSIL
ncbi:MAG TPA: hypothetical protein VGC21_11050 [Telluria sp.]